MREKLKFVGFGGWLDVVDEGEKGVKFFIFDNLVKRGVSG